MIGPNRKLRLSRWFVPHRAFRSMMLGTLIATGVIASLVGGAHLIHHRMVIDTLSVSGLLADPAVVRELALHTTLLWVLVGLSVGGLVLCNLLVAAYLSHKIVGPLARLEREVGRAAAGEKIRPITFRKGDQFGPLAGSVNQLLSELDRVESS